jgi:glycosyltransferase involved in cell wall biosynthesis
MNDLVSVIIPCYNGAAHLGEAIASVFHQSYADLELILVDDGSTDSTATIAAQYPVARYIYQSNQGVASARNRGIQESSGSYLLFLDQDDRLLPNAVMIALERLKSHPECAFAFGQCRSIRADGSAIGADEVAAPLPDYAALLRGQSNICPPSTVLFRRDRLVKNGGFDARFGMADDYDVYLKLARQYPIDQYPDVVVEYRKDEANQPVSKLIQLRSDTLNVMQAQPENLPPEQAAALQEGKTHWQYFWETILIHCLVKSLWRREGRDIKMLWRMLRRSPILFSALSVYLSWWMKKGILRFSKFFPQPQTSAIPDS